jgi:hypothetical protein
VKFLIFVRFFKGHANIIAKAALLRQVFTAFCRFFTDSRDEWSMCTASAAQ